MDLLAGLANGRHGLRLRLPASWPIVSNTAEAAQLVDHDRRAMWWLFAFPGLHFDASGRDAQGLTEAARDHARAMFEEAHAQDTDHAGPPRTADADWTPLVELEHGEVQSSPVVRSIHRMIYRPGREIMLGHLLVPRPWGLFEARVATSDETTGYRETTHHMLLAQQQGLGLAEVMKGVTQATYDDPSIDAQHPQHCLSRSRAALRWLVSDSGLQLDRLALPGACGDTTVPELGCAFAPPPRFFATPGEPGSFKRTSFCGTDGIEQLFVRRHDDAPLRAGRLEALAESASRQIHVEAGVEDVALHVEHHAVRPSRSDTLVIVDGRGHQGRRRNGLYWLLDDDGRPWVVSLISSAAVPRERLAAELLGVARTWRLSR